MTRQFTRTHFSTMLFSIVLLSTVLSLTLFSSAQAQSEYETALCEAAKTNRMIELVYDKDISKGCLPRLVDVHQVAMGNNGQLYMHGWQSRGCTKGRDYAAERIFRFDKIQSVKLIDGAFDEKSRSVKAEGWDGCIGSNCFIKENICE
ncbi:MAG: WYL domain-containing protein [Salaquimonas sp.]